MSLMNSAAFSSGSPFALRFSLTAAFRKFVIDTPGISTGYWNDRNSPSWARSSGFISRRFLPLYHASPSVTS